MVWEYLHNTDHNLSRDSNLFNLKINVSCLSNSSTVLLFWLDTEYKYKKLLCTNTLPCASEFRIDENKAISHRDDPVYK